MRGWRKKGEILNQNRGEGVLPMTPCNERVSVASAPYRFLPTTVFWPRIIGVNPLSAIAVFEKLSTDNEVRHVLRHAARAPTAPPR